MGEGELIERLEKYENEWGMGAHLMVGKRMEEWELIER